MATGLRGDCERCAGLCCVAFAFDVEQGYPKDKPNGVACEHLGTNNRCSIYESRVQSGFASCEHYDCLGAGQVVTQDIFEGQDWRSDPQVRSDMVMAFVALYRVHELKLLLEEVDRLDLSIEDQRIRDHYWSWLEPADGWTSEGLRAFERQDREQEIRSYLSTLRRYV